MPFDPSQFISAFGSTIKRGGNLLTPLFALLTLAVAACLYLFTETQNYWVLLLPLILVCIYVVIYLFLLVNNPNGLRSEEITALQMKLDAGTVEKDKAISLEETEAIARVPDTTQLIEAKTPIKPRKGRK